MERQNGSGLGKTINECACQLCGKFSCICTFGYYCSYTGHQQEVTESATIIYFFARLFHAVLFTLGVPVLRIIAFLGGFYSQMLMVVVIMQN